jgi:hypothetical protein
VRPFHDLLPSSDFKTIGVPRDLSSGSAEV